jgi:hypothetical protein
VNTSPGWTHSAGRTLVAAGVAAAVATNAIDSASIDSITTADIILVFIVLFLQMK